MTLSMSKLSLSFVIAMTLLAACSGDAPKPQVPATPPVTGPKVPLVEKTQVADWCPEHDVPESICTRCNAGLVDSFKSKCDWCAKHELPNSQCFTCHPELEAKFLAMKPKDQR